MAHVLFLCTGNYYRSRFAEHLFDHLAPARCPGWRATSRALALERGSGNVGPISPLALSRLARLGVALPDPPRMPERLTAHDLAAAGRIIALDRAEHLPLLEARHAEWLERHRDRVGFWDVGDVAVLSADRALALIERHVGELCRALGDEACG